jgi:hypothetical protein
LGTTCLQYLDDEDREEIQKRVGILRILKDQAFAKSLSRRSRELRSTPRKNEPELTPDTIENRSVVVEIPSRRKRLGRNRRATIGVSEEEEEEEESKLGEWKGTRASVCVVPKFKLSIPSTTRRLLQVLYQLSYYYYADSTRQKRPKREDLDNSLLPSFDRRVIADSEEALTDDASWETPSRQARHNDDSPCRPHACLPTCKCIHLFEGNREGLLEGDCRKEGRPNDRLHATKDDLLLSRERYESLHKQMTDIRSKQDAMQSGYETAIQYYKDQSSQYQSERDDLKRRNACLQYACPKFSEGKTQEILRHLDNRQKVIDDQETSLGDKLFLRAFSTLSSAEVVPLDISRVREEMADIGEWIQQTLFEAEDHEIELLPRLPESGDLRTLVCRTFGLDETHTDDSIRNRIDVSGLSVQDVIRALTASALCQWVFESDLQVFPTLPCALLEQHRSHLATQGILASA